MPTRATASVPAEPSARPNNLENDNPNPRPERRHADATRLQVMNTMSGDCGDRYPAIDWYFVDRSRTAHAVMESSNLRFGTLRRSHINSAAWPSLVVGLRRIRRQSRATLDGQGARCRPSRSRLCRSSRRAVPCAAPPSLRSTASGLVSRHAFVNSSQSLELFRRHLAGERLQRAFRTVAGQD
jgi:hypothetical protein